MEIYGDEEQMSGQGLGTWGGGLEGGRRGCKKGNPCGGMLCVVTVVVIQGPAHEAKSTGLNAYTPGTRRAQVS